MIMESGLELVGSILLLKSYHILLPPVGFLNEENIRQGIITSCKCKNWIKEFDVDLKPKQGFLKVSLRVYIPVRKPCGGKMWLGFKRDLMQLDDSTE